MDDYKNLYVKGGVGNDGGTGAYGGFGNRLDYKGNNGTGGLLVVFANIIDNLSTGKITSDGVGNGTSYEAGGSSGGGSINVFYKERYTNQLDDNIKTPIGGISAGTGIKAGNGGNGSITIGNISSGVFVKDE